MIEIYYTYWTSNFEEKYQQQMKQQSNSLVKLIVKEYAHFSGFFNG